MPTLRGSPPERLPSLPSLVRAARAAWPDGPLRRFRTVEDGWDHRVLVADDRVVVRFPRRADVAARVDREVRVLGVLRRHLTTPIPEIRIVGRLDEPPGWPFVAYRRLAGTPLSRVPRTRWVRSRPLARFVGELLEELRRVPTRGLRVAGAEPARRSAWVREYRRRQREFLELPAPAELRDRVGRAFAQYFAADRRARFRPIATHRDLGPDHILWDAGSEVPTGVIDWDDACVGDPAFDLTGLASLPPRDLASWAAARRGPSDPTFDERLRFYRRIAPIHAVQFGVVTGNATAVRSALARLGRSL